jgi:hypothetical protein
MNNTIKLTLAAVSFLALSGFGVPDDVKRIQYVASITQTTAAQTDQDAYMTCVATEDATVAKILSDKDKMSNLKDLPVKDLEKIDKVTKKCNQVK